MEQLHWIIRNGKWPVEVLFRHLVVNCRTAITPQPLNPESYPPGRCQSDTSCTLLLRTSYVPSARKNVQPHLSAPLCSLTILKAVWFCMQVQRHEESSRTKTNNKDKNKQTDFTLCMQVTCEASLPGQPRMATRQLFLALGSGTKVMTD